MAYLLQQILNALQLGSIYSLIALGYTMVYGVLGLINFAHGDLFMVAAFLAFAGATMFGFGFVPTLLFSMAAVACLAALIERLAYRPLRGAPKVSAIITALGVGLFLENFTLALVPNPQHVPELMKNATWSFGGVSISSLQLLIIILALGLMFALDRFIQKTTIGIAMRAISWDRTTAALMGVPVNSIISLTFAIGGALGAAAGVLYAMAFPVVDPYMGVMVGWKAFIAAVLGGIGNVRAAVLGGFVLAAIEIGITAALPSTYRDLIVFSVLLVLLVFRPQGLLGKTVQQKV